MENVEMKKTYGLLLTVPGMNEVVKLEMKLERRKVLFLCQLLTSALGDSKSAVLEVMTKEDVESMSVVLESCLDKAGLAALFKMLKG